MQRASFALKVVAIVLTIMSRLVTAIEIGPDGSVSGHYGVLDEESRFFPGTYFFHKGCDAYSRGNTNDAISLWEKSASWGHKSAQYNLGIAYFKGQGVGKNVPLGLAWLGLASERHNVQFQDSMDAAWFQASVGDRVEAKRQYALLKPRYGDDFALKRALRRYEEERRNLTGSHVGAVGNLRVYVGGSNTPKSAATYLQELEEKADNYFNSNSGTVSVGDLIPLLDPANSEQRPHN